MPKETFLNLSTEKQERISEILLDVYADKHASLVTVAEIVERMGMSRSAFYKYFEDLEDAHHYIIKKYSLVLHGDILTQIMQHQNDFFGGIRLYLAQCSTYKQADTAWKIIRFLTLAENSQRDKRQEIAYDWTMLAKWNEVLVANKFKITDKKEAISFLYFVMDIVMNCLADYIVNDWQEAELLADYDYRTKWLMQGLN